MNTAMQRAMRILIAAGVLAGAFCPVGAQEVLDPEDLVQPEGLVRPGEETESLQEILDEMSPEELETLVKQAARRRLATERLQVVTEIRENLLYEESAIEEAVAALQAAPANTQADNIQRILKAFGGVDDRFAPAWKLYAEGGFAEAADALQPMLNPEEATYLSAAMYYACARAQQQAGRGEQAVQTYSDLLVNLPDRISFAAAAALQAAELYRTMHRGYYAMEMYAYALNNYSLTMDAAMAARVMETYEKLKRTYEDPMGSLVTLMQDARQRLGETETGKPTQSRQEDVLALLEDLIRTAEEKNRQQQQSQASRQQQRRKDSQQGRQQQQQQQQSNPQPNSDNPVSPAQVSKLVPGPVSRPNRMSQRHGSQRQERWAELPPRQREQIRNILRQRLAEHRGDQVRDYHKSLSESE